MPILKIERTSFSLEDLKSLPIIGKSPYENYQIEDIQKSLNRSRYGLFLDTGTGKSFIILSAINILRKRNKLNKILYITSNSGVYDIKEKFLQFTDIPEDRIQIGNKHNRKPFSIDCDVIICNYRSFLLISDEYQKSKNRGKNTTKNYRSSPIPIKQWLNGDKGCCVLDESHNIAIPQSRQTKAIHLIREYFYYRYVLTGTPEDKEEKYYSQLKFLDTSLVRNFDYYDWLEYYANLGNRFSQYAIDSFKPKKLQELQEIVKNNCSRRLAEDVLLLPPNLIKKLYVEMNPIQKTIYEEFVKEQVKLKKQSITGRDFKNLFPKLLMAVDNPERIDLDGINNTIIAKALQKFKFKSHHPKIEILEDILLDHEGKKIIIWTSHPHVGFNLQELLKKYNPFIINGEVPVPKEYKTKEEYKSAGWNMWVLDL
ncbi:MAG TPA: SNF2-related protein, partial [Bacteroidales bacterium]|nr:SNF2-related protein [Bacteroidales bacterium]